MCQILPLFEIKDVKLYFCYSAMLFQNRPSQLTCSLLLQTTKILQLRFQTWVRKAKPVKLKLRVP